jgi:hypothetical protein
MNTSLTVKLNADTNFIPVMYRVVETTVGATLAATFLVLEVVRVGWDTVGHYNDWKAKSGYADGNMYLTGRKTVGIIGTLGTLTVAAADTVSIYKVQTPSMDS